MGETGGFDDLTTGGGGRLRRAVATAALVLATGCLAGAAFLLMTHAGKGGLEVPALEGETFEDASERVESSGLWLEIDPRQDTSSVQDTGGLLVIRQDPKAGTRTQEGETVVVLLDGLDDVETVSAVTTGEPPTDPAGEEGDAAAAEGSSPATRTPAGTGGGRVCLDPGHSAGSPPGEIDPSTWLDVADNSGAAGELQAMWELAVRAAERLRRDGFEVVLTKPAADAYASLRTRADIGNTCSIVIRLHYDPNLHALLYPGEGQYKERAGRRVYVDPGVARESAVLANALFPYLREVGVERLMNDVGGTSSNSGPAFVGSVLSRVPVVLIENNPSMVRDNPRGQELVAEALARGVSAYFQGR